MLSRYPGCVAVRKWNSPRPVSGCFNLVQQFGLSYQRRLVPCAGRSAPPPLHSTTTGGRHLLDARRALVESISRLQVSQSPFLTPTCVCVCVNICWSATCSYNRTIFLFCFFLFLNKRKHEEPKCTKDCFSYSQEEEKEHCCSSLCFWFQASALVGGASSLAWLEAWGEPGILGF